jgi:hypothetical protein
VSSYPNTIVWILVILIILLLSIITRKRLFPLGVFAVNYGELHQKNLESTRDRIIFAVIVGLLINIIASFIYSAIT